MERRADHDQETRRALRSRCCFLLTKSRLPKTLLAVAVVAIGVAAAQATASSAPLTHRCVVNTAKPSLASGGTSVVAFASISCAERLSRGFLSVTLQWYCTAARGHCAGKAPAACSGSGKTASQTIVSGPQNKYDFATAMPAGCGIFNGPGVSFYVIDDANNQVLACHQAIVGPPPNQSSCGSSLNPHDYSGPVPGDPHSSVEPSSPFLPSGSSVWHVAVQTNSPYCGSSSSDSGPCASASVHIEYIWSGRASSFVPYWAPRISGVLRFSRRGPLRAHHKLKISALLPVCRGQRPTQWRTVATLHLPGQPALVTMGAGSMLDCYPG